MKKCDSCAGGVGLLVLRLTVGGILLAHGISKLMMMTGVVSFFAMLGLPEALAWAVAIGEAVFGVLMILGIFVEISAIVFAIIMIGALIVVKLRLGFPNYDIDVALLGGSLALVCLGSGRYAICPTKKGTDCASCMVSPTETPAEPKAEATM